MIQMVFKPGGSSMMFVSAVQLLKNGSGELLKMGLLVSNCANPCDCISCTGTIIGYVQGGSGQNLTATYGPQNPIKPPSSCPIKVQLYGGALGAPTMDVYLQGSSGTGTWDYQVTYDGAIIYSETGTFNSATQLFRIQFQNPGWNYGPDVFGTNYWLWDYTGGVTANTLPQIVASLNCSLPLSQVTW